MTWTMQHPEAAEAIIKIVLACMIGVVICTFFKWKPELFGILAVIFIIGGVAFVTIYTLITGVPQ